MKPRWDLRLTEKNTWSHNFFNVCYNIRKYGYAERSNWCLDTIEIIEISKFISLLTTGSTYPKTIYQKKTDNPTNFKVSTCSNAFSTGKMTECGRLLIYQAVLLCSTWNLNRFQNSLNETTTKLTPIWEF